MNRSIRELKGVGEKTERLFAKLGVYDTEDLLHFYPRNYEEYEQPQNIADLPEGTVKTIRATIVSGFYTDRRNGQQPAMNLLTGLFCRP